VAIAAVCALLVVPLALLPVLVVPGLLRSGDAGRYVDDLSDGRVSAVALAYINLVLGALILVAFLSIRVAHGLRPRWLSSVRPGLRWRWLGMCALAAAVVCLPQLSLALLAPPENSSPHSVVSGAEQLALILVIATTTPLQAAGEEYFFRGYLNQVLGTLVRRPWFAMVGSSSLFALAHGTQNLPLFVDRFGFGLIAAFLVWRTGGLEAGIAWHIANNFVALLYAVATDRLSETLSVSQSGWPPVVADQVQMAMFAVAVLWLARRVQIERLTDIPRAEHAAG
jgi:membrane protease YdiL (CAAX protease family)